MSSESRDQLAAHMQTLSLNEHITPPIDSVTKPPRTKRSPVRVDCLPLPPLDEYYKYRGTGAFYYGIYMRERAAEDYAIEVNPELAKEPASLQYSYGLDYLQALVRNSSIDVQIGVLRPRHKVAMPFITEEGAVPILCLFPFGEEAYEKRMMAKKVEKLCRALRSKADWFELSCFI